MEKVYEVVKIKQIVKEVELLPSIRSPFHVVEIAKQFIGDNDRESFLIMCLNVKNRVTAVHKAHTGTLNASYVHPREVFKTAYLNNAASIVVAHNHPSGDVEEPSIEDIKITDRLIGASKILGIPILDHIIVTYTDDYYSFFENGRIDKN